jgi:hypothetical protein
MTETSDQVGAGAAAGEQAAGQTTRGEQGRPSAEERAEALMERAGAGVGRFLARAVARTREEVEDIVAEAQAMRHGQRPAAPGEEQGPGPGEGQGQGRGPGEGQGPGPGEGRGPGEDRRPDEGG